MRSRFPLAALFPMLLSSALLAGTLAAGSLAVAPVVAIACDDEAHAGEGKCDCGKDEAGCAAAKAAGNCGAEGVKGDAKGCACSDAENCGCADGTKPCDCGDKKEACACVKGEDGKCACAADCPAHHGGACPKAKQGASAAPAGSLRAVVDPATGKLAEASTDDEAAAAAAAVPGAARAATDTGAEIRPIAVPGAGTMAEFPADRASQMVAKVGADGTAHAGCEHAQEAPE